MRSPATLLSSSLSNLYILLVILTCNIPFATPTTQQNDGKSPPTSSTTLTNQEIFENDVFSSILNADNVDGLTTDADGNIGSTNLVFQPAAIDFKQNAIGEPQSRVITVFNKHRNQSVYLGSISGNVPDFYTSYFSDKVIPPEGNIIIFRTKIKNIKSYQVFFFACMYVNRTKHNTYSKEKTTKKRYRLSIQKFTQQKKKCEVMIIILVNF